MKTICNYILFLTLTCFSFNAQVPVCAWMGSVGGIAVGESICSDAGDNVMVIGSFEGPSLTIGATTLTNLGGSLSRDIFIARYNGSGQMLWAKSAGGIYDDGFLFNLNERGSCITSDKNRNVLIAGGFRSPAMTFDTHTITGSGNYQQHVFVAKYDSLGNVLWAKSAGGNFWDDAHDITCDAAGNVYVVGCFQSNVIVFGSYTLTNADTANSQDIYVAKYDPSGNVIWAKRLGGNSYDKGFGVSVDGQENVFVTGQFASSVVSAGSTTLTNSDSNPDMFIAKLDASGNALWARSAGANNEVSGYGISADREDKVFLAGAYLSPTLSFGSSTLTNQGNWDVFVAKYDGSGNLEWVNNYGGIYGEIAHDICTDTEGNALITGSFSSPSLTIGGTTLVNTGGSDLLLAKFNAAGQPLWASSSGGQQSAYGISISADGGGNVLLVGQFNTKTFSIDSYTVTNLDNSGGLATFIAKLGDNPTALPEELNVYGIHIFPIPTSGPLHLNFMNKQDHLVIKLRNSLGQVILELKAVDETELKLDISSQPGGIYFIEVKQQEVVSRFKIIKN